MDITLIEAASTENVKFVYVCQISAFRLTKLLSINNNIYYYNMFIYKITFRLVFWICYPYV